MMAIERIETSELGVDMLDSQHRRLIYFVNDFHCSIQAGGDRATREALGQLIEDLINYARFHFRSEEQLMRRLDYPEVAAHEREHAAFSARIADARARFIAGKPLPTAELTRFLSDWIESHLEGADGAMAAYVQKHGPSSATPSR